MLSNKRKNQNRKMHSFCLFQSKRIESVNQEGFFPRFNVRSIRCFNYDDPAYSRGARTAVLSSL